MASKELIIIDPRITNCSQDSVKSYKFTRERDFLYGYLPTVQDLKDQRKNQYELEKSLPVEMYLKSMQAFREDLISKIILLKRACSEKVSQKIPENGTASNFDIKNNGKPTVPIENEFEGDFAFFKGKIEHKGHVINLIKDVVQGYFDKQVFSTKFAIGSNYYQTDYASFEIITNLNVKQTEILIKLSEIKENSLKYKEELETNSAETDKSLLRIVAWMKNRKEVLKKTEKKFKKIYTKRRRS